MDPYVKISDHVAQGLALIIEQYKNKPKAKGLIESYLRRIQDVEDAAYDLYQARKFQPGLFGVYLERYGKLVGAKRNSSDNLAYFTFIQAQILINKSSGTIPELIEICRVLTDGTLPNVTEVFPASLIIELPSNSFTTDQILTLAYAFHASIDDGIHLNFIYPPDTDTDLFTFYDFVTDPVNASKGFSSVYDTGTGGRLVAVI